MFKRKARKAVGKIANQDVIPLEDSVVMVKSYIIAEHTAAEQIKAGTVWSIYDDQKSLSKVHGPIIGIVKLPCGKKSIVIDNILPPRAWTRGPNFRHEFYE